MLLSILYRGGTSLRGYLARLARKNDLEFHAEEGGAGDNEMWRNDTLYVSHLREPISPTISHFKYDQRWPCRQLIYNRTFQPTLENAAPFENFIVIDDEQCDISVGSVNYTTSTPRIQKKKRKRKPGSFLWACAGSCYIRWFNYPDGKCDPASFEPDSDLYNRAVYHAQKHHIIIDVQQMYTDDAYAKSLENFFGAQGIRMHSQMFCDRESKAANNKIPLEINATTMEDLKHRNRADTALYDKLVTCPSGYHFPTTTLMDHVAPNSTKEFPEEPKAAMTNFSKGLQQPDSGQAKKQEMTSSPVCLPSFGNYHNRSEKRFIRRIHFRNKKKSGGTSLRHYLSLVAKHFNIKFDAIEGGVGDNGRWRNDTLYVTHLREPVSRAISHFKYNQRWDCDQLVRNRSAFVPTLENAADFASFEKRDESKCDDKIKPATGYPKALWTCTSSCFIRWFNFPDGKCDPESFVLNSKYYHQALAQAQRYHIILDVQKLYNNNYYARRVEHFFGGVPGVQKRRKMFCEAVSERANEQNPLVIDDATMFDLRKRNAADSALFQSLTTCLSGIHFPDASLADYVVLSNTTDQNG